MRRLPNNELHKALLKYLGEGIGKDFPKVKVYDYVPEGAKLPYVTVGSVNVRDRGLKVEDISHVSVQIHIWSSYKGRRESNNLAEKIIRLVAAEQIDLSGDGFCVISQDIDFYETYPEGETGYNGVLTLETDIQNMKEK